MIKIFKTSDYKKMVARLENKDRVLLEKQEDFLLENIFHPQLHIKKLKGIGSGNVFSFRINRSYRGIFYIENDEAVLFAVGHRKDIYESF